MNDKLLKDIRYLNFVPMDILILVSIPVELTQVHIMFNLILDEDVFSQRHNLLFYYHRRFCPIVFFDNYTFI